VTQGAARKPVLPFDELEVGLDLGQLEYLLDQETLDRYLGAIQADHPRYRPNAGPQRIAPPSITAADALKLVESQYDISAAIHVGQWLEMVNPPLVGKRVTVRGRLADKFRRRGRPFAVLESTSQDEDGRLLVHSRTVGLLSLEREEASDEGGSGAAAPVTSSPAGEELPPVVRTVTLEHMRLFEPQGRHSIHTDDEVARAYGLPAAIAAGSQTLAHISEMLFAFFGDDYLYDSLLDVRFLTPVFAGDQVTARGVIQERQACPEPGRRAAPTPTRSERLHLNVWCQNQRGQHLIDGTAQVTVRRK